MRNVVQDQSVFGLAARRGVVYGGTSITGGLSTTPPTRKEGTVFAWDAARSRKLWETVPVPGAGTVSSVAIGSDGNLWGIAGRTVFAVEPRRGTVVRRLALGTGTAAWRPGHRFYRVLYAGLDGDKIFRIDPRSPRTPTLVVEHRNRRLAVGPGGKLFFSDGADLYRVDPQH